MPTLRQRSRSNKNHQGITPVVGGQPHIPAVRQTCLPGAREIGFVVPEDLMVRLLVEGCRSAAFVVSGVLLFHPRTQRRDESLSLPSYWYPSRKRCAHPR